MTNIPWQVLYREFLINLLHAVLGTLKLLIYKRKKYNNEPSASSMIQERPECIAASIILPEPPHKESTARPKQDEWIENVPRSAQVVQTQPLAL
jgi:hypothetical protein